MAAFFIQQLQRPHGPSAKKIFLFTKKKKKIYIYIYIYTHTHTHTHQILVTNIVVVLTSLLRLCNVCVTQSCPILCNPMDCSPPGTSVHEDSPDKNTGVVMPTSRGSSQPRDWTLGLLHCRQPLGSTCVERVGILSQNWCQFLTLPCRYCIY